MNRHWCWWPYYWDMGRNITLMVINIDYDSLETVPDVNEDEDKGDRRIDRYTSTTGYGKRWCSLMTIWLQSYIYGNSSNNKTCTNFWTMAAASTAAMSNNETWVRSKCGRNNSNNSNNTSSLQRGLDNKARGGTSTSTMKWIKMYSSVTIYLS